MEDRCISCGEIVPEGRMVCPLCMAKELKKKEERMAKSTLEKPDVEPVKNSGIRRIWPFAK